MSITSAALITGAGIVVSVIFSWFPYLNTWYAKQTSQVKQLVMLAVLIVVSIFMVVSSCLDWWVFITCDKAGILDFIAVFGLALATNQGAYKILPQPQQVLQYKEASKRGLG